MQKITPIALGKLVNGLPSGTDRAGIDEFRHLNSVYMKISPNGMRFSKLTTFFGSVSIFRANWWVTARVSPGVYSSHDPLSPGWPRARAMRWGCSPFPGESEPVLGSDGAATSSVLRPAKVVFVLVRCKFRPGPTAREVPSDSRHDKMKTYKSGWWTDGFVTSTKLDKRDVQNVVEICVLSAPLTGARNI